MNLLTNGNQSIRTRFILTKWIESFELDRNPEMKRRKLRRNKGRLVCHGSPHHITSKKKGGSSHHCLICACHRDIVRACSACTPPLDF